MYNFFHVYKYQLGVLATLMVGVGVIRFPLNLFADTTSFFNATTSSTSTYSNTTETPVTFSVVPTSSVDCTEPAHPKTKTTFFANPTTGGSFTLLRGTASEATSVMPGIRFLPNGVYNWSAVVNPHYLGSGILHGKFVLDVACTLSSTVGATATTSTVSTESVVVTTGSVTIPHDDDVDDDDNVHESTTSPISGLSLSPPPSALLPSGTTTFLPKISLPPPPLSAASNQLPTSLIKTIPTPLISPLPSTPIRHEEDEEDEEGSSRVNIVKTTNVPPPLFVEHFERFDEKKQKEITNKISRREQQEIVDRVKSPAVCTNVKECAVYCEQKEARETSACVVFAQKKMPIPPPVRPSLVGNIPFERIDNILTDMTIRPALLPSVVKNPQEFQQFCMDLTNIDMCAQILVKNKLLSNETIIERTQAITQNHEEEKKLFAERTGVRIFVDSDDDELADYDEVNIYHTNPKNRDTDRDGISDGDEIASRSNPRSKASIMPSVTRATTTGAVVPMFSGLATENNPLISGTTDKKLLIVKEVIVSNNATSTPTLDTLGVPRTTHLTFTGMAMPNSFVTLYIFSEPIVVMVKTNSLGEWSYTLDKELPDGTHHVVSAITDGDGRVLAKSEPLPFVKVAEAVTLGSVDVALPLAHKEPGFFSGLSLYTFVALMVGIFGLSFLVIGVIVRRRESGNDTMAM